MENLQTIIHWTLNDYCRAQCEYCPMSARGGTNLPETEEYIRITNLLIDHYNKKLGRKISWVINGGEPLDINDIAMLLKLFRTNSESLTLHTNGGRLWMDWWAIEPYVDNLVLTFHFWQNPALIKYIIQTFTDKNKQIQINAPIRPGSVKEDLERVENLEKEAEYKIPKRLLYINGDNAAGLLNYSQDDLRLIDISNVVSAHQGPSAVEQKNYYDNTTWDQRYFNIYSKNPVYAGQYCNAGIERLYIGAQGWVTGSSCNNQPLGNIFQNFNLPDGPQKCGMISCINGDDQKITKFSLNE
jgi:organic radical activating enzyme